MINYRGKTLIYKDKQMQFDYNINNAIQLNNTIIILFNYKDFPNDRQADNLQAFTINGKLIWKAKHPTNQSNDVYTEIIVEDNLKAYNCTGYSCKIDLNNGNIVESVFTK